MTQQENNTLPEVRPFPHMKSGTSILVDAHRANEVSDNCVAMQKELERKNFQLIIAEQSRVNLMMKVELLESLLRQHHEDREDNDNYYDTEYDLYHETLEALG